MRVVAAALGLASVLAAPAAHAQAVAIPVPPTGRYDSAPWWMDKPIIASMGHVKTEVLANRAGFSATYNAVDRSSAAAAKKAADQVRALGTALAPFGAENVRLETTFSIRPLYDQYRDKDGELIENERADKIQSYEVVISVRVEVRDVRVIEQVYATALAAKPSSTSQVLFSFEADNEMRTQMQAKAIADATRRARLAVEATGARLGSVRLIDASGRACDTDVLVAGAPRSFLEPGEAPMADAAAAPPPSPIQEMVVTSRRRAAEVGLKPEEMQLPLHPPLTSMEDRACVVFALG